MIKGQMRKKGPEMARLSEQEVNAALDLLNRLADEVEAEHPDLEDEQVACDLLGARAPPLDSPG
jgi:hypothetical protein